MRQQQTLAPLRKLDIGGLGTKSLLEDGPLSAQLIGAQSAWLGLIWPASERRRDGRGFPNHTAARTLTWSAAKQKAARRTRHLALAAHVAYISAFPCGA